MGNMGIIRIQTIINSNNKDRDNNFSSSRIEIDIYPHFVLTIFKILTFDNYNPNQQNTLHILLFHFY